MARPYAKVLTSIWTNRDFTGLPSQAQRLYLLMLSQPHLSYCGVVPFTAKRWAGLSGDGSGKGLERSLAELEAADFVLHDPDTEEVLIRTFIRHDGVLKSPNICKAMVKDYCAVLSTKIREAIEAEFPGTLPAPLMKAFPEGFPEPFAEEIVEPRLKGSDNPSPNPSPKGLRARSFDLGAGGEEPFPEEPPDLASPDAPPPPPNGSEPVPTGSPRSTLPGVVELALLRRGKHAAARNKPDPHGWLERARAGIRADIVDGWKRVSSEHPDWDDEQIADALGPVAGGPMVAPTRHLAAVPLPPLEPDPDCPYCEGTGMAYDDQRRSVDCACKFRSEAS
jgi:hypothetical protein